MIELNSMNNMGDDAVVTDTWLNDTWSVYFHNPYDNNWDENGYIKIFTISNIEEYLILIHRIKENAQDGMFFIMRDNIFPKWNDDENKHGGFLSIKILKEKVHSFFYKMTVDLVNETLLKPEYYHQSGNVNGLSISPKKHFCIIKVWLKNCELDDSKYFNISKEYHGSILFKTNTCTE